MKHSHLKLSEKNVAIYGPLTSVVQAMATTFVEHGCDVVLITKDINHGERYCTNLSDMREIHSHFGRARAVDLKPASIENAKDCISRVAEIFGGVDIFIDANIPSLQERAAESESFGEDPFAVTHFFTEAVIEFLKGRTRGRIFYLYHEHYEKSLQVNEMPIVKYVRTQASKYKQHAVTVNAFAMGATDEFLLNQFPEKVVSTALEKLKNSHPFSSIVDSFDVANTVAFFASPLASATTGQVIKVTNGMDLGTP